MTNAENETIIRWDCEDRAPVLYAEDRRPEDGDPQQGDPRDQGNRP